MCLPLEVDVIVYFTTVNRTASINADGEIVSVDWERKKILGARPITPIRFSGIDDNPRGGTRGGRGRAFILAWLRTRSLPIHKQRVFQF